ncbi:MAG TPA: hypothetical protein VGR74_17085 [Actinomycetota bacterium]|jgi:hypothetical protein|nr:hypothetical protein [Actinomycetota bacterium]
MTRSRFHAAGAWGALGALEPGGELGGVQVGGVQLGDDVSGPAGVGGLDQSVVQLRKDLVAGPGASWDSWCLTGGWWWGRQARLARAARVRRVAGR